MNRKTTKTSHRFLGNCPSCSAPIYLPSAPVRNTGLIFCLTCDALLTYCNHKRFPGLPSDTVRQYPGLCKEDHQNRAREKRS